MNKTTIAALITIIFIGGSSLAHAQSAAPAETAFVNINFGGQTQSRDITTNSSIPLYGEVATVATAQRIGAGALFDVSGGYRITPAFAVGIGFSRFSNTSAGSLSASIPNPFVFNRPAVVTVEQPSLEHSEVGTHLMAMYFMPVTVNFDVMVSGGPSFTRVTQDVPSATVATGTQTPTISVASSKGTAKGINIGVAGNYLVTPRYGAAAFLRYVSGSADLPEASDLKIGGLQIGVGATIRF